MKASLTIVAVLLTAGQVIAQAKPASNQTGGQGEQAQGQNAAKPAAPNASQAQPSSGANKLPKAKTQEEFEAYQDAVAKTDPAGFEAVVEAFVAKFPNSELREILYVRAMNLYQQSDNTDKEIAMGRKAIAVDPTDPVPLIHVASALAESTRDTDLDRQERLNEAAKDAQAAIDNVDTGLHVPPNTPPEKVAAAKTSILAMSYETLGVVYINQKNYPAAEQNLQKAVDIRKASPEASAYLRLSVAQDNLEKYPQALESANKAAQLAQPGTLVQNLAKQQQARLQKLVAAGPSSNSATPPVTTPAPAKSATTQPPSTPPPTTPH
jgi:tetratricopeptide (TPR) repeat protein